MLLASSGNLETPFGFVGEMRDASGLLYLRARYYAPQVGRFISTDPFVGYKTYPASLNPYQYGYNNPLRYVDPSGEFAILVPLGIVFTGGVISAGASALSQYMEYGNWNCINWREVAISGVAGAGAAIVGMTVGALVATAGAAVFGEGLVASIAVGAMGGVVSGQYARMAGNLILGRDIAEGLFNPKDMLVDGVLGGLGGAAGYAWQKIKMARAAKANATETTMVESGASSIDDGVNARKLPGVVSGGENLSDVSKMMRGSNGNAGVIPKEIADNLRGSTFNNFDEFRAAFWQEVGYSKYANEFTPPNISRMENGFAPIAHSSQQYGKIVSYILHHMDPIYNGGGVYDLDNIRIVTPRLHQEILYKLFHFNN